MNMDPSNASWELGRVRAELRRCERTLDDLWGERALLWRGLGWSRPQLRLWLRCLPGIGVREVESDNPSYGRISGASEAGSGFQGGGEAGAKEPGGAAPRTPDAGDTAESLGDAVARIVAALGKPVPLALVRAKLPPGQVVTDTMIRAAVQAHPGLTMTGPLIRRSP